MSKVSEHCKDASVDKNKWDKRPDVLIPTIAVGILGY